jgi:hypothetical protein
VKRGQKGYPNAQSGSKKEIYTYIKNEHALRDSGKQNNTATFNDWSKDNRNSRTSQERMSVDKQRKH